MWSGGGPFDHQARDVAPEEDGEALDVRRVRLSHVDGGVGEQLRC
jgi:hypothetical protein